MPNYADLEFSSVRRHVLNSSLQLLPLLDMTLMHQIFYSTLSLKMYVRTMYLR